MAPAYGRLSKRKPCSAIVLSPLQVRLVRPYSGRSVVPMLLSMTGRVHVRVTLAWKPSKQLWSCNDLRVHPFLEYGVLHACLRCIHESRDTSSPKRLRASTLLLLPSGDKTSILGLEGP